ncbi:MAG: RHS repeat-associated core domain-containing protein, partial [Verrucomicrobia bacterium]|nr:RHS repeat-associated core domain-containing protein [Verrucomicrobiota bacterium]
YEYDCIGKVVSITYPDGDQVSQEYNSRNLLTRVHGSILGDLISNISYRPSGQLSAIVYGNKVETAYQYDPRLRLTHLETTDSKGTDLINFEYTFDAVSNIRQITDLRKKLSGVEDGAKRYNTQVFEYDDLYRLTQAQYPSLDGKKSDSVNYRYDRIGNMLSQVSSIEEKDKNDIPVANLGTMLSGGTKGSWNRKGRGNQPGPHAVTSVGTRQFTYDGNGNMTTADGMTYTWDFKDRLVAVEDDTMRAEYVYDYTDRRIVKRVWQKSEGENAKPAEVYYVNQYFEVREHNTQTKYIWSDTTRVARVSERINEGDQIQRVRLNAGWNLIASQVSGKFPVLDPNQNPDISASFWWSGGTDGNGWSSLTSSKYLNAGATIWVYAKKDISVALKGSVTSAALPELNGQSRFIANILGVPLSIKDAFPAESWIAQYKDQHWENHLPSVIPVPEDAVVEPGGSVWVSGGSTEIIPPDIGTQLAYYHQDHLGSSGVTTDAQGNLIEEISYFAFGGVRNQYAPRGVDEPYQFTQKERDKESQLNYFESRYYNSNMGRFQSVDIHLAFNVDKCMLNSQKLNLYSYCQNQPTIYIDPTGCDNENQTPVSGQTPVFGQSPVSGQCSLSDAPNKSPVSFYGELNGEVQLGIHCSAGSDVLGYGEAGAIIRGSTKNGVAAGVYS